MQSLRYSDVYANLNAQILAVRQTRASDIVFTVLILIRWSASSIAAVDNCTYPAVRLKLFRVQRRMYKSCHNDEHELTRLNAFTDIITTIFYRWNDTGKGWNYLCISKKRVKLVEVLQQWTNIAIKHHMKLLFLERKNHNQICQHTNRCLTNTGANLHICAPDSLFFSLFLFSPFLDAAVQWGTPM